MVVTDAASAMAADSVVGEVVATVGEEVATVGEAVGVGTGDRTVVLVAVITMVKLNIYNKHPITIIPIL